MFSIDEISNGGVNLDNKVIYSLQLEIIELNDEINITAGGQRLQGVVVHQQVVDQHLLVQLVS